MTERNSWTSAHVDFRVKRPHRVRYILVALALYAIGRHLTKAGAAMAIKFVDIEVTPQLAFWREKTSRRCDKPVEDRSLLTIPGYGTGAYLGR